MPTEAPPEELAEHIDRYFGGLPAEVRDDEAWVASWADRTAAGFELRNEPGAHLFIREGWAPVVDAVSAVLRPRLLG